MKIIGWIMLIVAVLIVVYNVATTVEDERNAAYNQRQMDEHPIITVLSDGENLRPIKNAYTFMPPYTGFEVTVIAGGLIGLGLVIYTHSRRGSGTT